MSGPAPLAIDVQLLTPTAVAPRRMRPDDAAMDLRLDEAFVLHPGERRLARTGIAVALPPGTCGLVLSRSGLPLHHGIMLGNAPGLIDSSYRGEVGVIVVNVGDAPYAFEHGDRIAQLLVMPVPPVEATVVDALPASTDDRGTAGFGSSGR